MTAPSPQVDGAGPAAPRPLRVATRRSALALAQSRAVGEQLATLTGRPLELVEVTSVMPSTALTALSIGLETCASTTSGAAPA